MIIAYSNSPELDQSSLLLDVRESGARVTGPCVKWFLDSKVQWLKWYMGLTVLSFM